jgi:hypothetical protein
VSFLNTFSNVSAIFNPEVRNSNPKPKIMTGTTHTVISSEYWFIAKYQIIIPDTTKNTILSIHIQPRGNLFLITGLALITELTLNAIVETRIRVTKESAIVGTLVTIVGVFYNWGKSK